MAAQLRYRTLVHNIGRVYASPAEGRTDLLQAGLDEIVTSQRPATAADWNTVGTDSERLLKVWVSKEGSTSAHEVAAQIVDLLYELAAEDSLASNPTPVAVPTPALVVTESAADRIAHVLPFFSGPMIADSDDSSVVSSIAEDKKSVNVLEETDEIDAEVEAAEAAEEAEEEGAAVTEAAEEAEEEGAAVTEAAEEEEEEEEAEEEEAEEEAAEEEVLEPEEAEEEEAEEEGMEVEQLFIRGRAYWHETNTHKLYELVGDDDVGDEVGELISGKPRFYAK